MFQASSFWGKRQIDLFYEKGANKKHRINFLNFVRDLNFVHNSVKLLKLINRYPANVENMVSSYQC